MDLFRSFARRANFNVKISKILHIHFYLVDNRTSKWYCENLLVKYTLVLYSPLLFGFVYYQGLSLPLLSSSSPQTLQFRLRFDMEDFTYFHIEVGSTCKRPKQIHTKDIIRYV